MFALHFTHRILNTKEIWRQIADGTVDHTLLTVQLAGLIFVAPEAELSLLSYQFAACRQNMDEVWQRFNARYDTIILHALEYANRVLKGRIAVLDIFVDEAVKHDVKIIRGEHKFAPDDHYNGEIYITLQFLLSSPEIPSADPIYSIIQRLIEAMAPKIRQELDHAEETI